VKREDRFAARGRNKAQTRRAWALYTRLLYAAKSWMLVTLLYCSTCHLVVLRLNHQVMTSSVPCSHTVYSCVTTVGYIL
jgi:hypothetical protein